MRGKGTQLEDRGKRLEINKILMQPEKGYSLGKVLFFTPWVRCMTCSSARMPCPGLCGPSWSPAHDSPASTAVFEAFNKDIHFSCLWCQKRDSHMHCPVWSKRSQQNEQGLAGCRAAYHPASDACRAVGTHSTHAAFVLRFAVS